MSINECFTPAMSSPSDNLPIITPAKNPCISTSIMNIAGIDIIQSLKDITNEANDVKSIASNHETIGFSEKYELN